MDPIDVWIWVETTTPLNINILNVKLTQLKKENPLKPSTSMTLTLKNLLIFQSVW